MDDDEPCEDSGEPSVNCAALIPSVGCDWPMQGPGGVPTGQVLGDFCELSCGLCLVDCDEGDYDLHLVDTWGDGWNGATLSISDCDGDVYEDGITLDDGMDFLALDICLPAADGYIIEAGGGAYDAEILWSLLDSTGTPVLSGTAGTHTDCPPPPSPPNVPFDCDGTFEGDGSCSAECGGGTTTETYVINSPAAYGGAECVYEAGYTLTSVCNTQMCDQDCVGVWGVWNLCSEECGGGTRSQVFTVAEPAVMYGAQCDAADGETETEACNTDPCPVDCVGSWTGYSSCTAECGGGSSTRSFVVTQPAVAGGLECDALDGEVEGIVCNADPCPIDCEGAWGGWGGCSVSCGGGERYREFEVSVASAFGGAECEAADGAQDSSSCGLMPCPIDCVGSWGEFGECSMECGTGFSVRTYTQTVIAEYGGIECPALDQEIDGVECNTEECPPVGTVSAGLTLSGSVEMLPPTFEADFISDMSTLLNIDPSQLVVNGVGAAPILPPIGRRLQDEGGILVDFAVEPTVNADGTVDESTLLDPTAVTDTFSAPGVSVGGVESTEAVEEVEVQPDPIHCEGHWGGYGACSTTCDEGISTRYWVEDVAQDFGGDACLAPEGSGALTGEVVSDGMPQAEPCNLMPCPRNCEGEWGPFGECPVTCGGGVQTQTFEVSLAAAYGGVECGSFDGQEATQECGLQGCPQDCQGEWSDYGACSVSCGSGIATRTFTQTVASAFGGTECSAFDGEMESVECSESPCPVGCEGDWGPWSTECTATCGGGVLSQEYSIASPAQYGGAECDATDGATNTVPCGTGPCVVPVDCVGSWGSWSECSGTGTQIRLYSVSTFPSGGGANCEANNGEPDSQTCEVTAPVYSNGYTEASVAVVASSAEWTTVQLTLTLSDAEANVYTIYAAESEDTPPMTFPPVYQSPIEGDFGAPAVDLDDSYLTIGDTDVSGVGIDTSAWDSQGLTVTEGAYYCTPTDGPSGTVVIAQLSVPCGTGFEAVVNAQGESTGDNYDWQQTGITFSFAGTPCAMSGMCSGNSDPSDDHTCQSGSLTPAALNGEIEGNTDAECCEITGMCAGNSDPATDYVCATGGLVPGAESIVGGSWADCCHHTGLCTGNSNPADDYVCTAGQLAYNAGEITLNNEGDSDATCCVISGMCAGNTAPGYWESFPCSGDFATLVPNAADIEGASDGVCCEVIGMCSGNTNPLNDITCPEGYVPVDNWSTVEAIWNPDPLPSCCEEAIAYVLSPCPFDSAPQTASDGSCTVDFADRGCPDGYINAPDLLNLLANIGTTQAEAGPNFTGYPVDAFPENDDIALSGDGIVNVHDLLGLLAVYAIDYYQFPC